MTQTVLTTATFDNVIAKGGSGRRIYVPASVLRDVWDFLRFERAEVIEDARIGEPTTGCWTRWS